MQIVIPLNFRHFKQQIRILGILLLAAIIFHNPGIADDIEKDIPVQFRNCGISSLTRVGQLLYDPSYDALTQLSNPAIYNMYDLYNSADLLKLQPVALHMTIDELKSLNGPSILHLSKKHFVTVQEIKNNTVLLYDSKEGEKWMSFEELEDEWSGNLICFEETNGGRNLTEKELKALFGYDSSYHSSYPPGHPVYPDTNDVCKNVKNCGDCGKGAPAISVSPLNLNVVVEDIPLWYNTGTGPDVSIQIYYKNEASQPDIGNGTVNTQFYPMGVNVFFNYSTFYVEKPNSDIFIVMPNGMQLMYTYNAGNYIPPSTNYHTLEPSGDGFVMNMKESQIKYFYTHANHSKLTAIEDRNGNRLSFFYDADHNLDYFTDANGRTNQVTTDINGRISQIQDPIGRTALFEYDTQGYLTNITDMGGYESFLTYGIVPAWTGASSGTKKKIISVQTPTQQTTLQYEIPATIGSTIPLYRITLTNGNGDSQVFGYAPTYSDITPTTAITTYKDFNGNTTQYTISRNKNRIDKIVYPDIISAVFYEYDQYGYQNKVIESGYVTDYSYDSKGNIIQISDPRNKITTISYDSNDNIETITDPMNRVSTFAYDANNNIMSLTTEVSVQSFTYLSNGNLESFTDANNNITTFNYDSYGYISSINFPLGNPTTIVNDPIGRPTATTTNGLTINYEYDDLDQLTKIIFPDGSSVSNLYDFTNIIETNDRGDKITSFTYDCGEICRLIHVSKPEGEIMYDRDKNGNITSIKINGLNTSYVYDNLNRNIRTINPDGTFQKYTYDAISNIVKSTDENGVSITYIYDYDLLNYIDYGDATPDVSFDYSDNGELTEMSDGQGTTNYQYDNGGRLTNYNGPNSDDDIIFTYDDAGNQLSMSVNGFNVSYTYDDLSRLTNITSNYSSANYTYDNNNKLTKSTYGNGTYTDYTYDLINRLNSLSTRESSTEIISEYVYAYDNSSLIKKIIDESSNTTNYEYDNANRLIKEDAINSDGKALWKHDFSFDNMGNRTSINRNGILNHYSYNLNNQLTSMTKTTININGIVEGDSLTVVYVENIKANTTYLGNNQVVFEVKNIPINYNGDSVQLYAKINDATATVGDSAKFTSNSKVMPDGTVNIFLYTDIENVAPQNVNTIHIINSPIQFTYDDAGNLIERNEDGEITSYNYNALNLLTKITLYNGTVYDYEYDGMGQRVKELKNGILQKIYIYDKYFEPVAIVYPNESKVEYITHGFGFGGNIAGVINVDDDNGESNYYHYNHRGDVNIISNQSGIPISNQKYSAFGASKNMQGSNNSEFGFSTKEYNSETGLSYFGWRYYSMEMGRWISKDPIGFNSGDLNSYVFGGNNPVNWIDPYGQWTLWPEISTGSYAIDGLLTAATLVGGVLAGAAAGTAAAAASPFIAVGAAATYAVVQTGRAIGYGYQALDAHIEANEQERRAELTTLWLMLERSKRRCPGSKERQRQLDAYIKWIQERATKNGWADVAKISMADRKRIEELIKGGHHISGPSVYSAD